MDHPLTSENCAATMTDLQDQHEENEQQQDPTPPEAEETGTTPSEADNSETTQPEADQSGQADIDQIVKKRLARERKKWEAERTKAEERARMDEAERLKAELQDRDEAIAEYEAQVRHERTLRTLSGKVVDPEDALAIAERAELVDEDGNVDVDALLKAKPYLAPQKERPNAPSALGSPAGKGRKFTQADLAKMTADEINENWDAIQADLRK